MRNMVPGKRTMAQREGLSLHNWRALRDSGARLQALHNLQVPHSELHSKNGRLRSEAHCALQIARTCAMTGAFRPVGAADLAGLVNHFARLSRPPVTRETDSILGLVGREVAARGGRGALACWSPQHLAMMANGLARCRKADIRPALTQLARALPEVRHLLPAHGWNAQSLALMANALARGEGVAITQALDRLSQALVQPGQLAPESWSSLHQVLMANGLSRGEGVHSQQALTRLAQCLGQRQLTPANKWTLVHLAMMARVLGKVQARGDCAREALGCLAQAVLRDLPLTAAQWRLPELVMMAGALAQVAGPDVHQAQMLLAGVVHQRQLSGQGGTARELCRLLEATGQALAGHPLLEVITSALTARAAQAPGVLVPALVSLARLALSGAHLTAAHRLLAALEATHWEPGSRQDCHDLLWSTTLLHFGCQLQPSPDPQLAASFAHFSQYCLYQNGLACRVTSEGADNTAADHLWQTRWAADYWQRPATGSGRRPAAGPVTGAAVEAISRSRQELFRFLQAQLQGHVVQRAVPVHLFPVDILIDGRVCIEVDGPGQQVEVPVGGGGPGGELVRTRRTRDLFVDHMLRRYGYQVLRMDGRPDQAARDALLRQVRALLDAPAPIPVLCQPGSDHARI